MEFDAGTRPFALFDAPACTSAADMQTTRRMKARRRRGLLPVLAMSGVFKIMPEILQKLEFWLEIPAGSLVPGMIPAQ